MLETINQPLLHLIDLTNFRFVDPLLHFSPNVVINWVRIRAVEGHSSDEINAVPVVPEGDCLARSVRSIVLPENKEPPQISRMANSKL